MRCRMNGCGAPSPASTGRAGSPPRSAPPSPSCSPPWSCRPPSRRGADSGGAMLAEPNGPVLHGHRLRRGGSFRRSSGLGAAFGFCRRLIATSIRNAASATAAISAHITGYGTWLRPVALGRPDRHAVCGPRAGRGAGLPPRLAALFGAVAVVLARRRGGPPRGRQRGYGGQRRA